MHNLRSWFRRQHTGLRKFLTRLKIWEREWFLTRLLVSVFVLIVVSVGVVFLTNLILQVPDWPDWTGFNKRDLWNFADLVFIPLTLAIVGYYFTKIIKDNGSSGSSVEML